jgi:methyl-accepting chemotaxis protein
VDKRRAVDSGNATVAELQIFYLQKDPNAWVRVPATFSTMSTGRTANCWRSGATPMNLAATFTILAAVVQFHVRAGLGIVIAYRTATGITKPLNGLIHVAEQIGQSGDLDHTIDVRGRMRSGNWPGLSTRW